MTRSWYGVKVTQSVSGKKVQYCTWYSAVSIPSEITNLSCVF